MLKKYSFQDIEKRIYAEWLEQGYFSPQVDHQCQPFCIVIPPPNVTGSLHMGHAWDSTIQDLFIRWRRMQGLVALWIPGTDHAGIATQWMVEKQLIAEGTDRATLGREAFIERVWKYKEQCHGEIVRQLQLLGLSCDWERERFTLDKTLSKAVRKVFVDLYNRGLAYKAQRMVNRCPRCTTALSDLEVLHKEVTGNLCYIDYHLEDGKNKLTVATTRPETMLGDVAVAVHPDDERYRSLIGKNCCLPLTDRLIPIIADEYVDLEFGTGALKVTPAHDPNDFKLAQKHQLSSITVIDTRGMMVNVSERYQGLERNKARELIMADLSEKGLIARSEPIQHSVAHCSRCGDVLEPLLSQQWFVNMQPMAKAAIDAVKQGRIRIHPSSQQKILFQWLENIEDWCISRQIWWGHRIPAWTCQSCQHDVIAEEEPQHCPQCSGELQPVEDVLDTWFSSALWPFSTMGWPEHTEDFNYFYPTSVLVTGYDILFFWVARMIMMGLEFTGKEPFSDVFIHGLLRDKHGQKMSKTKGNGIDPQDVIKKFGCDTLRLTIASGTVPAHDMALSDDAMVGYRNYINKIWNLARFTLMHQQLRNASTERLTNPFDCWIIWRLDQVCEEVNRQLESYHINEACRAIYQFSWREVCDWYVEIIKPQLSQDDHRAHQAYLVLEHLLLSILKLLHPIIPFATEELWQALEQPGSIVFAEYPRCAGLEYEQQNIQAAQLIIDIVSVIRSVRSENRIPPSKTTAVVLVTNAELAQSIKPLQDTLCQLSKVSALSIQTEQPALEDFGKGVGKGYEVYVNLSGIINKDAERLRIQRELAKIEERIEFINRKINNPAFINNAPTAVIDKNRNELSELLEQRKNLESAT